jgi:acylpyruvate hydrolase
MKIICIGRNYVAHISELNNEIPAEPVFFMKPDTSLLQNNKPFSIPGWSKNVHHEIELVIRISRSGKNIKLEKAGLHYQEIGLGIDFTARDIQDQLKSKGLPWEKAKAFDHAAVLGTAFFQKESFQGMDSLQFRLEINNKTVQEGNSGLMMYNFESIISYVSDFVTLKKGDLIYTGTPAGVGKVYGGDHLEGYLEGKKLLDFWVR